MRLRVENLFGLSDRGLLVRGRITDKVMIGLHIGFVASYTYGIDFFAYLAYALSAK